jgi:hypothetical protein
VELRPRFGWPAAFTTVAALLVLAGLYVFHSLRRVPAEVADSGVKLVRELRDLVRAFNTGTVETSFHSYATEVSGSSYLQFATLDEIEVFERSDFSSTLWGQIELPEVVVRATAPVQYTYYLDLDAEWRFELEGDTVRVRAPRIKFNKPSVDASRIEYEVRQSSVLRDEEAAMEKLRAGMSAMAHRRAQENVHLVRETGRRKTEEFVASWLLQSFEQEAKDYRVEVLFADEGGPSPPAEEPERGAPADG